MATKTVHLRIEGMSCPHCAETVERALLAADGVQAATVDLDQQEAVVQYDPALVEPPGLVTTVLQTGYQAKVMSEAMA
ncbi:MAG: heavy-metal-associated domain-containing protein [Armatimonadota bacterium]